MHVSLTDLTIINAHTRPDKAILINALHHQITPLPTVPILSLCEITEFCWDAGATGPVLSFRRLIIVEYIEQQWRTQILANFGDWHQNWVSRCYFGFYWELLTCSSLLRCHLPFLVACHCFSFGLLLFVCCLSRSRNCGCCGMLRTAADTVHRCASPSII